MKFRTDFVTNSSSSSYICTKVANFNLTDNTGGGTGITFIIDNFKFFGDLESSTKEASVPKCFNDFLIEHYRNTRKIANVNTLVDGLLNGKRTPIIKDFIKSTRMENISDTMSYFSAENGVLTSDVDNPLECKWEIFMNAALCSSVNTPLDYKCKSFIIHFYSLMGDSVEFIKVYENKLRYNFIIFHVSECNDSLASHMFDVGYDDDAEYIFGVIKDSFAHLKDLTVDNESIDEIIAAVSKKYLAKMSSDCNLAEEVIKEIESGHIKILFYAKNTGVCDEIIWYSGELEKSNIKIHLISEGEEVVDISDNTADVNNIIRRALNNPNKTVKLADKKMIKKELQAKVIDSISADVFDEPLSEEMEKNDLKRLVTVLFSDHKKYKYFCEFPVLEGDKVFVDGKKAGEIGIIVQIDENLPSYITAEHTYSVVRAFSRVHIEEGDSKIISLSKEEAKGIWGTKKDAMGHMHIYAYKGDGDQTLFIPSEIGGDKIDIVGLSAYNDLISTKRKSIIRRIVIGEGVKYIGRFAFAEMNELQNIKIPPSVTYISPLAFYKTNAKGITPINKYSYADSLVDYIGEYTGQFPLEGKSICLIDMNFDYRGQAAISANVYKLLAAKIGAEFQSEPNSRTSLIIIRDDFCAISDQLNTVIKLRKSGETEIKAITEKKFWALLQNVNDQKNLTQYLSITDVDAFVDFIGEYTDQLSLKGRHICLIDLNYTYSGKGKTIKDYKFYADINGAVFQSKPNKKTDLIIIRGDWQYSSDKLDAVFELLKSSEREIKAITEKKFWVLLLSGKSLRNNSI